MWRIFPSEAVSARQSEDFLEKLCVSVVKKGFEV